MRRNNVDWETFVTLARHHGLQSLANAHLAHRNDVPKGARDRLAVEARGAVRGSLYQTAILFGVLDDLTAAGVHARVLKGLPLAASLYEDTALRASSARVILRSAHDLATAGVADPPSGTVPRMMAVAPWSGGTLAALSSMTRLALTPTPAEWPAVPLPDPLFPPTGSSDRPASPPRT